MHHPPPARSDVDELSGPSRLPWWVQALDLFTFAACAAALPVLVGAPTRYRLGPIVLSLGSFWRPLVAGLVAATARHLLWRKPTLLARARTLWLTLAAACPAPVRAALPPFLLSRTVVLLVGYFAILLLQYPDGQDPPFRRIEELWKLPLKWDGTHYLNIAENGYTWSGDARDQGVLAFFPAYPVAARVVGWCLGGAETGLLVVALACFFWALTYFYRLAREHLDASRAETALLFLAFYPFAVFYSADYSESMFLLGAVAAFYHFRRSEWARASLWGLLVGLTRPNGCLLAVALAALAFERAWRGWRSGGLASNEKRRLVAGLAAALAPILGLAAHALHVYSVTGDPFTWVHIQQAWGRAYHGPALLAELVARAMTSGFYGYAMMFPTEAIQSLVVVLALASVWPVLRRFGLGYALFILVNLVPPLLTGSMMSMGRFTSTLFPMFLWLAAVVPPARTATFVAALATVQGFVATAFFTWRGLE